MLKLLPIGLLTALLFSTVSFLGAQVDADDKHQVAVRYLLPNYISPLSDIPSNVPGSESFGAGLQFEYQRRIAPNFLLGFPLSISSGDAIDNTSVDLTRDVNLFSDITQLNQFGLDALFIVEPIARRSFFDPQLFAGFGIQTADFSAGSLYLPVGINLNFDIGDGIYLSPALQYRISLDSDEGDIRNNLQLGAGLHFQLGKGAPKPPKIADTDGDGLKDDVDQCPTEAGPAELLGCPDTDGDGIADKNDKCPDVAGLAAMMGCPDTDGDGVTDAEDKCPDEAGTAALMGCPDNDNDGIANADDKCPDEAGPASNEGCPISDRDNDGIADDEDDCPDDAGLAALRGCPDTDGDGVADKDDKCPDVAGLPAKRGCPDVDNDSVLGTDDRCPTVFGPATNKGCPEINEEDQETINFAVQNINFETGKSILRSDSREILARVIDILKRYPAYKCAIGGHTDSIGSAESNMSLSERRAKAVLDYLVSAGIQSSRLTSQGFGETQPIADNRYKDGREQNRRVTLDLFVE